MNDSLTINNQKWQIFELEKNYETQKNEQEILNQESEISRQNTFIALLVASLSGLLLAFFLLFIHGKSRNF